MIRLLAFAVIAPTALHVSAQEMPLPAFNVGDTWSYREIDLLTKNETGRLTETVTSSDANDYVIDARRQARTWWRGDSAKRVHREQFAFADGAPGERGKVIATNDAGCAYPWPLKVGAFWSCVEGATFANGWKLRYELKYVVEATESVDTAAGKFETLRLKASGYAYNDTTNQSSAHERLIWLAPTAKREVKHEIRTVLRNGQVFRVEGRELVAMKVGG